MIDAIALAADSVKTIDEFKHWTCTKIRPVFPHEALFCSYGYIHAGGVGLDYVITVDYPPTYLEGLRNRAGGVDTPILRHWLATREPVLFEVDDPWPDIPAPWFKHFREQGMKNVVTHGVYDTERCVGTMYSFCRIPGRLGSAHVQAAKQLVPILHEMVCALIARTNSDSDSMFAIRFAGLSSRQQEIAHWVGLGKTNSEIAIIFGLSENTVKHHLTSIFDKLGVETRSQLVHCLAEYGLRAAPGFAMKIL